MNKLTKMFDPEEMRTSRNRRPAWVTCGSYMETRKLFEELRRAEAFEFTFGSELARYKRVDISKKQTSERGYQIIHSPRLVLALYPGDTWAQVQLYVPVPKGLAVNVSAESGPWVEESVNLVDALRTHLATTMAEKETEFRQKRDSSLEAARRVFE